MMPFLKRCHLCGYYARRGFTRRWLDSQHPVWVCQRIVDCERRRAETEAGS